MAIKTLVYDKWDAGEFGTMSPERAPDGSWTGRNMVVYRNGRIGPRPGLKLVDPGSVPPGKMLGFGFSPTGGETDTPIFFIIDTKVYLFRPTPENANNVVLASDELDTPPADAIDRWVLSKESVRLIADELYFPINGDKTYRLNCRTQTLTGIIDSPEGTDIETYRDRIFVANGGLRVNYSAPADFDTYPPENFFDVGPSWLILNMTEFRDSMVIFTQSGTWVLTGTPEDGTLRRLSDTLSPAYKSVVKTNDDIVYVPASRSAPVSFNGSYGDERGLAHLESWTSPNTPTMGVQSYGNRDAFFLDQSAKSLWRKNGAWSIHDFGPQVGPWVTRYFDDNILLGTQGSDSDDPDFYMLAMDLDRPAFTDDTWARPGDNSDTPIDAYFALPDYFDPGGRQVRVRKVIVDYYKYYYDGDPSGSETVNMDISISPLSGSHITASIIDPEVASLLNETISGEGETPEGVQCRATYSPGTTGLHGGFRLGLFNLRGVAIDRICVDIDTEEGRP